MSVLSAVSRFGMPFGLAIWLGLGLSLLLGLPVIDKHLPLAQAREVSGALIRRIDKVLFVAAGLVLIALAARTIIERAAPAVSLIVPLAVMTLSRLLSALTVSPTLLALLERMRDANAPASEGERSAYSRLSSARGLLCALEVCLGLYALYAVC